MHDLLRNATNLCANAGRQIEASWRENESVREREELGKGGRVSEQMEEERRRDKPWPGLT